MDENNKKDNVFTMIIKIIVLIVVASLVLAIVTGLLKLLFFVAGIAAVGLVILFVFSAITGKPVFGKKSDDDDVIDVEAKWKD